jgi:hypothetical protein
MKYHGFLCSVGIYLPTDMVSHARKPAILHSIYAKAATKTNNVCGV